jgi:hypothetical protein
MNPKIRRPALTEAQRQALDRRGAQLKTAGTLLGALFLGTKREQRQALDTIADDVSDRFSDRTRADDADTIVVDAELVEEEDEP